jgi:hypothetical protein
MSEGLSEGDIERARGLVEEGLREAKAIGHPIVRARHRASWAFRLSLLDPERAAAMLVECPDDPGLRVRLLLTVTADAVEQGEQEPEPYFSQTIQLARDTDPDTRLRVLNTLSEIAMEVGERDRETGLHLLRKLVPEAGALIGPGGETQQAGALACALLGEALLLLHDPEGLALLGEAERLSHGLPARDSILVFLANALAEQDPARAVTMVRGVEDPASRFDACLQLAEKTTDPELRETLFREAEAGAALAEHTCGPEVLVRAGAALAPLDPERARSFFQRAMESARESGAQMRSLQWTGIASALAPVDREWAERMFQQAAGAALEEEERVRRVTALFLIANEMAETFPREAEEVFRRAVEEAIGLEAMWEYAHVLDIIFRADRSPYLDVSPALPLIHRAMARISDEDPRIPGVFGLPEVARCALQIETEQAIEILQRWFRASEAAGDSDGMTAAAIAVYRADEEAGADALTRVRDYLVHRVDCPAMGEFSRNVAPIAPELVLDLAPMIPDARERTDAVASAAVGLYARDPEAGLAVLRTLERAADRSSVLLTLVDRLLSTGERPQPQPLLEELP